MDDEPSKRGVALAPAGTTIMANCLHPGAVVTRLGQNDGRIAMVLTRLLRPLFRTPDKGADTVVYLATSPEVAGVGGRYYARREPSARRP
jgi:retinol dehydrogenase 12